MLRSVIEIDTKRLINNLNIIRKVTGKNTKVCLPVKANAYGHGISEIAKISELYVDYFGVACLEEGVLLRSSNIVKPILVFGAFNIEEIDGLIKNNLEFTISSLFKAALVIDYCIRYNTTAKIHIKVDTGMNRVGVKVSSFKELFDLIIENKKYLDLVGVYSHLAESDSEDLTFTKKQINSFKNIVKIVKEYDVNILCHIANSSAICMHEDSFFDMVRPGILSYGYLNTKKVFDVKLSEISPCLSLKTRVIYNKTIAPGDGVSYNRNFIATKSTRVATIAIGYGDGLRRDLSNIGEVLIHGIKYSICGNICMDMTMVNIQDNNNIKVGDEVVLIGKQLHNEIFLNDMAIKCQTITYEILCGFNNRVSRVYL